MSLVKLIGILLGLAQLAFFVLCFIGFLYLFYLGVTGQWR